jgi:flagellar basal-body rod modification protein FlgD
MSTTVNGTAYTPSPDLMSSVNGTKTTTAKDSVQADTDKFMTLLVTQLKNQDPLNPLDNAQLTSQLAQLSTVTGVNKLNTTLEALQTSYQQTQSAAATGLIGQGVLVPGNDTYLTDGKAIFGVDLATAADSVKVIISDPSTGKDIQVMDLGAKPAGSVAIPWNGVVSETNLDASGKPVVLKNGNYQVRVEATAQGAKLTDAKMLSLESVLSVSTAATGVKLNLSNQTTVTMADVKQIL